MSFDYDVLVIGSGFGGSVTALRLTEKGYRVGVIEAGARFEDEDLPSTEVVVREIEKTVEQIRAMGLRDMLSKPLTPKALSTAVQRTLAR